MYVHCMRKRIIEDVCLVLYPSYNLVSEHYAILI